MEKYKYDSATFQILESSVIPFSIFQVVDKRVVTLLLSQGFLDMFDYVDKQEIYDIMDNDMYRFIHPDDAADMAEAAYRFAAENAPYDITYRLKVHGEYRIIHACGKHIDKGNGVVVDAIWYTDQGPYIKDGSLNNKDLSATISKNLKEKSMSRTRDYDYLTGFPSMTYFFELADTGCKVMRERGESPVIAFLDFNGMKSYNQKYGMEEGDRFLVSFGRILTGHFGNKHCSRFSADHFCVFTDSEGIMDTCEEIIEQSKNINGGKTMPLRIGVYHYDSDNISISAACDRAKIACDSHRKTYESHIYIFDKEMTAQLEKRQYIVENLDRALKERWIQVYHQPIIRTANDQVCNEEALARWVDPERGIIRPGDFIPVLEEANSVYKLDLYVVERVLEKIQGQKRHNVSVVPESVNFSRADFYTCDLVEEIRKRVDDAGVERDKIIIEITESTIADDIDYMTSQIERFKELGFTVWMDDYGSGYSSPMVLQKIPFDLLKIDMMFVEQISEGKSGKIILTEMVRMAMSLGIETIAEGVETKEQMEFLKEIGCTKLQGYYFAKPLSLKELIEISERDENRVFENPEETDYYVQIGKVNLYDLSISRTDEDSLKNYFDTLPMLMIECKGDKISFLRCNESFRNFYGKNFPQLLGKREYTMGDYSKLPGSYALNAIIQCSKDGQRAFIDDRTDDGKTIHMFIRRFAVNPVTGAAAVGLVILSVNDSPSVHDELTYNYVARALSEDYVHLYFVNLDTEEFTEYSPDGVNRDISVERRGTNFFEECKKDAPNQVYADDVDEFFRIFNRENIEKNLSEHGNVTHTYRILQNGEPVYVNMKIVAERNQKNYIIIGVNNVDAQMRHKEALEKIKEERVAYSRISALSGDFMAIYTIDPVTDDYSLFSSKAYYNALESSANGKAFYAQAVIEAERVVYPEDLDHFKEGIRKEIILDQIMKNGIYVLNYRLIMDKRPVYVQMKAALVHEDDTDRLIIGVVNVDDETRRKHEYETNLMAALEEANIDELTGVKNKHAYVDVETILNKEIEEGRHPEFAIAVFDLNDLKLINDTKGHQAGDRYIKEGCKIICRTFKHSPVFRIGGDEFAVVVQGEDYNMLDDGMDKIARINQRNKEQGKVVIAAGASRFYKDKKVSTVFERADKSMYTNKADLKS